MDIPVNGLVGGLCHSSSSLKMYFIVYSDLAGSDFPFVSPSPQVGVSLLLVGIVALNRVRMEIPLEKENQTKLVKFMIRMGVFSVLYLVPLLTVIGCYIYEHNYRSIWETTWMEENCRRYHIPCPYKVNSNGMIHLRMKHLEQCIIGEETWTPFWLDLRSQRNLQTLYSPAGDFYKLSYS